ncbi:MAG: hypothetical protein RL101_300 [Actinomycetota bacterium]|jgi:hypothetical protein
MALEQRFLYREWQYPRVASFLPVILFVPAVWLVGAPLHTDIGLYVGLVFALIAIALKLKTSKHIEVNKDSLILGDAELPRKILGKVTIVDKDDHFFERGAGLDARAFVFLKYGLPEMVKIEIADADDPTPYLLISTRSAEKLLSVLR